MREIKFRMWSFDDKTMYPYEELGHFIDLFDLNQPYEEGNCFSEPMQFTGLKDRNGTEVYEKDIVYSAWTGKFYVVEWDEIGAGYVFNDGTGGVDYYEFEELCGSYGFEVVGNTYGNPDLLKETKE